MQFNDLPLLPGGVPFLGHITEVRQAPLRLLQRIIDLGADACRVAAGRDVMVANSPQWLHEVLVAQAKSFEKSPILRMSLEPLAGQGLFTSEGELWRRQRKLMAPLFHHEELRGYAAAMRQAAERAAASWIDGGTIDAWREMTRVTMGIAGKTLFDADTFVEADAIGDAITVALDWAAEHSSSILTIIQATVRTELLRLGDHDLPAPVRGVVDDLLARLLKPLHLPGERTRKLREALEVLEAQVARMIAARRAAVTPGQDLLSSLLAARGEDGDGAAAMSDKQVRDEILTLFIAGHETTASGLAWALHLCSRDPAIYAALRAEVDALEGRPAGVEELPRLPLALRVFKEALRLYPPIFAFGRQAIADVEIAGYHIPKGTVVLVSPYTLQRRPDLYPDPTRFDPARFLPEAEARRPRQAFLAFSAGPRTCIGNSFALMEGPIVLATLLQRFDFEAASDVAIDPEPSATLRPAGGVPLGVKARASICGA